MTEPNNPIPDSWTNTPLSDFATDEPNSFVDGPFGSDLKVSDYTDDGVRILQLQNLGDGHFIDDNVKFTSNLKAATLSRCLVRPGDLLIAKMADPLARACIVPKKLERALIVADLIKLRLDRQHDATFIASAINGTEFRREAERLSTGTTRTRISLSTLKRIRLKAPPSNEQRRIGILIRALDEAIEQTEALIAKHQQIKAGLMHDLFTRGVTPDGHLRPTREQAPDLYKESLLGWIPKEWETATLSDRGRPGRPHLKTGPFGSSLKIEHWVEEGHPVITIGALGDGEFLQSELLFVSDTTAQRLREYQLEVGDVVFSRVADVGRSAVILTANKGWIMSSNFMRISLDEAKVRPAYLQVQLAHDSRVRAQIRATINAGGRDVVNSQILNRLLFAWPHPDEQTRILDRVEALDGKRQAETTHLGNLIKQKNGLMQDLLTGKVRVLQ